MMTILQPEYISGYLKKGYFTVCLDTFFTTTEKEEFLSLNKREVNGEILTEDELDKLNEYRDIIIDNSITFIQDYEIKEIGKITNWDAFAEPRYKIDKFQF